MCCFWKLAIVIFNLFFSNQFVPALVILDLSLVLPYIFKSTTSKKIYAERHEEYDPCCQVMHCTVYCTVLYCTVLYCQDKFADVTYYLLIWRRPKFFLFNYIQPAVLINIIAL